MNVFISHSHRDNEIAQELSDRLALTGNHVWRDQPAALGESLSGAIAEAVDQADVYLILVSPHLLDSEWSLLEVGGALAQSEQHGKPIIPIVLDPHVEVPALLRDRHYIDLSDPASREEGLREVEEAIRADRRSWQRPRPEAKVELVDAAQRYLEDEVAYYLDARERQEQLLRRRSRSAVLLTLSLALSAVALVALGGDALLNSLLALLGGIAIGMLAIVLGSISGVLWPSRRVVDLLLRRAGNGDR